MNLAAYTLKPPTGVTRAVLGRFLEARPREEGEEEEEEEEEEELLALVRGSGVLEIVRVKPAAGEEEEEEEEEMQVLCSQPTFSSIRALTTIRPVGCAKDLLVVGSDSGVLSLIELTHPPSSSSFPSSSYILQRLASLPLGPSGSHRSVPGHYIAADPAGRAIFTSSLDGHKACAVVLRDKETGKIELREAKVRLLPPTHPPTHPSIQSSSVLLFIYFTPPTHQ